MALMGMIVLKEKNKKQVALEYIKTSLKSNMH